MVCRLRLTCHHGKSIAVYEWFMHGTQAKFYRRISKKLTRMQLVRAKNRTHSASQNLQNMKERVQKMLERMHDQEAEFEAAKEDVERLKARLKDDD